MKSLQRWLVARFKGPFRDCKDSLEHGVQQDGFSCLICSSNTIAHAVFGDELWHMDRASLEKANWFQILIKPDCEVNSSDDTHDASMPDVTSFKHPKLAITNLLNPEVIPEPAQTALLAGSMMTLTSIRIHQLLMIAVPTGLVIQQISILILTTST